MLAEYGDQVQFVWRDFPIITAQSPKAAEAGQCAFDQGKFWEYHDYLFERANSLSVSDLKAYAREVGLDGEQFDQCLDFRAEQSQSRSKSGAGLSTWFSRRAWICGE